MTDASQIYGTLGSVPSEKPSQTSGAKPFGVSANPNTFGAQVGEARQMEGRAFREAGQASMDYAMKYTGMINETLANERAQQYAIEAGKMRETMLSKKGLEAAKYVPEYVETLTKMRLDLKNGLPNQAARSFDSLTNQDEVYAINSGHSHAASQVREANYQANVRGADFYALRPLDPQVANSDEEMGRALGNMGANLNAKYRDMPGTTMNPETGMVEFLNTPEGETAKDELQRELEKYTGDAQLNRFSTLLEIHGAEKAYQIYEETKENIPGPARVKLEAYLEPRVREARANGVVGTMMDNAMREYYKVVSTPEEVRKYNSKLSLGDAVFAQESTSGANAVTSDKGAVGGMQITPDTWETWKNLGIVKEGEDINNPADNKAAGYRALQYYTDQYNGDTDRALVAYFSGPGNVAPMGSETPWLQDYSDGRKLTSEYVSEVRARMGGAPGTAAKSRPSYPSQTDYIVNHYDDIQREGAAYAERVQPGDAKFAEDVFQRYERLYNQAKRTQAAEELKIKTVALKALNGDFTKGEKPVTEEQLREIAPELKVALARWEERDPKGYRDTLDNVLTENARGDTSKNSVNYYRVLMETMKNPKATEESIHGLLSRKDGTGINMKDYNDLTRVLHDRENNPDWIDKFILPAMEDIVSHDGNLDGRGESRALQFLNLIERTRKAKETAGVPIEDMMTEPGFFGSMVGGGKHYLGEMANAFKPTKEQQLDFMAKNQTVPAVLNRGDIVMGHVYIGGDPSSSKSWRKAN